MTRRALVVDDDRAMVKTLSDVLELKGWEVRGAYSGAAAVEATAREPFDVVLMDIKMPGMDGVDAFKAIKKARPATRVVLMTAYAARDRVLEAEREGVMRVLPKPVNIAELLSLLGGELQWQHPVLLVDHDVAFLKTLSDVLRMRGIETAIAENIDHATRLMAARRPIAVLLHMHLNSTPPSEAVSKVHAASPEAALIVYSGRPHAAQEAALALPANWIHAYLQKPFAIDAVTQVLDDIRDDR
jgi:two-component system, NtrC family, response regulator HydG